MTIRNPAATINNLATPASLSMHTRHWNMRTTTHTLHWGPTTSINFTMCSCFLELHTPRCTREAEHVVVHSQLRMLNNVEVSSHTPQHLQISYILRSQNAPVPFGTTRPSIKERRISISWCSLQRRQPRAPTSEESCIITPHTRDEPQPPRASHLFSMRVKPGWWRSLLRLMIFTA